MSKDTANLVATVLGVVITLITIIVTCSRAFDRIENHEERLVKIEKKSEERDESLRKTLGEIKDSTNYLNWRMDSVVKTLDKKEMKR